MDKANLLYDFIIENDIASEEALDLATNLCGYSLGTMNSVIYCKTAYHDIEELWDCEKDCYYFNDNLIDSFNLIEG